MVTGSYDAVQYHDDANNDIRKTDDNKIKFIAHSG